MVAGAELPVRIIFFEQSIGCETCAPTRRVLEQIVEENPDIALDVLNLVLDKEKAAEYGVDRVPAIIITAPGCDRIRYYGAPLGNELPTLLQAINMTATGETTLTEQSRAQLKALSKPVTLQVFFTPTCVYCPQMISLANQAAIESPLVTAVAIDATEFPDLVRRYNVNGVPKTVINDTTELMGAAPEDDFVAALHASGLGIWDSGFGLLAVASLVCFSATAYAQAPVSYHLSFPEAQHHRMQVEVTFPDVPPGTLEVMMSRTSPGRYAIHEFARNVYDVQIDDGAGGPLAVERPNPSQWNVGGASRHGSRALQGVRRSPQRNASRHRRHARAPEYSAFADVGARTGGACRASDVRRTRAVEGRDAAASDA